METVLDLSGITAAPSMTEAGDDGPEPTIRRNMDVEVNGRRFEVALYVPESALAPAGSGARPRPKRKRSGGAGSAVVAGSGKVAVPMQGTIVKVEVEVGQEVTAGDTVVVLEAMKMENNVAADIDGTVTEVNVEPGQSVGSGDVVVVIEAG
ncbi:MAG: biotin/lipoyl-binding protein [Microthrixaceae bacterium]|nr:biotin/lipoyl-binding protein [Microthrixaceae bacterium]